MKVAMKAKDKITLSTIRSIKAALTNAEKETGVEGLSDEQVCPMVSISKRVEGY